MKAKERTKNDELEGKVVKIPLKKIKLDAIVRSFHGNKKETFVN